MNAEQILAKIPQNILKRVFENNSLGNTNSCQESIVSALESTVLLGGKRVRPLLTQLIGHYFGVEGNNLDVISNCLEWVHAASLSHDDVIDEATLRRGASSINHMYGNKKAVLAGDYLLSHVIVELSKIGNLDIVSEMAKVIMKLSEGEWLQADAIVHKQYTMDLLTNIADCKTASVMGFCGIGPGLLSNDPVLVQKGAEFGRNLGLGFQFLDDTLDFNNDGEKDFALDLKNGQINTVYLLYFSAVPALFEKFREGRLEISDIDFQSKDFINALKEVKKMAFNYANNAQNSLNEMKSYLSDKNLIDGKDNIYDALSLMVNFLVNRNY